MADRRSKSNSSNAKTWNGHKSRNTNGHQTRAPDSPNSPLSPSGQSWQKKPFMNSSNNNRLNTRKNNSSDNVRKIVQEEGRSARNLITWSVPLQNGEGRSQERQSRLLRRREVKPNVKPEPVLKKTEDTESLDPGKKDKKDIRARYWAFLFDNLERAVDEIYKTCEADESEVQCKEVIMMLEQSSRDFRSLIERLKVIRDFENAQTRPTSLAWELRKTSPGKNVSPVVPERLVVAATKRILTFTKPGVGVSSGFPEASSSMLMKATTTAGDKTSIAASKTIGSYADRVRGIRTLFSELGDNDQTYMDESERSTTVERTVSPDMGGGWETVQSRRHRIRMNGKASSTESWNSNECRRNRPSPALESTRANGGVAEKKQYSALDSVNGVSDISNAATHVDRAASHNAISGGVPDEKIDETDGNQMKVDPDLEDDEEIDDDVDDDYVEMQAKLYDELEVMNEALQEEQALEMNNNIEDAVTEQMKKEEQEEAVTEEAGTQTVLAEPQVMTWEGLVEAYKASRHISWGEMVDVEERTPGRSVQMHEKLSSPSRKPSTRELSKKHEEKQLRAQQLREKLQADKAERLRELAKKVEIVTQMKEELGEQRRDTIEQKMRAAEQKRNRELRKRMQKAHDEETKANEIAFINSLEAQNKKHDIEIKHQECQARLLDIAEERQRKNEEKAAKEAAVEERRKALEADRLARLQEMQERRRQRETEFEQRQQEKEKERIEAARAKEKDREERLAAIKALHQAQIEELRAKIQEKQDESARRHSEKLDQIREKAFEMTILRHSTEDHSDAPKLTPYDKKKLCVVCNVLLPSEVHLSSHLRGKKHQQSMVATSSGKNMTKTDIEEFNLTNIKDAPSDGPDLQLKNDSERRKALKKRCKKLRQRMCARGAEYEISLIMNQQNSENKQKLQKFVKDINKVLQIQSKGPWAQDRVLMLDRTLFEVGRILDKNCRLDPECFCVAGGITSICRILMAQNDCLGTPLMPDKTLIACASTLKRVCQNSVDNCRYMLFSNKLGVLVDFLASRFALQASELHEVPNFTDDQVATSILRVLVTVLASLSDLTGNPNADLQNRVNDVISYLVSVGVVDRVNVFFSRVSQPIENNMKASEFLDACLQLLQNMINLLASSRHQVMFSAAKFEDQTMFIQSMTSTELCGTISLLYSVLLNTSSNVNRDAAPAELCSSTIQTALQGIEVLNAVARLNVAIFQSILGEEGTWLEFRHICSYLIWYCTHFSAENLLHQLILSVGYFTVLSADNQLYIQSGQSPTVLQQLCSLPFQYFSNNKLTEILFPTLIACSYKNTANRHILENELSCALLSNFIEENMEACKNEKLDHSPVKLWNRFPVGEFETAIAYYKV